MPNQLQDLKALQRLLAELNLLIETAPLPQERGDQCKEVLRAARAITENLIEHTPAAAMLGKLGGQKTAKRGPGYFKQIAGMRKTKAGGRPKKNDD